MNRLITISLVLFLACRSRHSSTDINVLEVLEHDDAISSDEKPQDNGDTFVVEYGGPKIAPEGPSELFIRASYSSLNIWGEVVCTLVREERDYRASNCRLCSGYYSDPFYECADPELLPPDAHIDWDRSGTIVPRSFVEAILQATQNLPKVERMTSCSYMTDSGIHYYAKILFSDHEAYPPIEIKPNYYGGDCSPHYVIQGDDMWCDCSDFNIGSLIGSLGPPPHVMSGGEGLKYCSCFEDFGWYQPSR